MRAELFLADWAEVLNGKLYAQGIGWNVVRSDTACHFAICALVHVAYDETNTKHSLRLRLLTEDEKPFPPNDPLELQVDFELGRPPGMRKGEESNIPFVGRGSEAFPSGGYVVRAEINGQLLASAPFAAKERVP